MTNPTTSGAVIGAALDTTPTRKAIGATGALGTLLSVGIAVYGLVAKNPNAVKEISVAVGGLGGLSSVTAGILGWIRTAEAEVEHAIATVEAGASQVTGVPQGQIAAIVNSEVARQLANIGLGNKP